MINKFDAQEIAKYTADVFQNKMAHRSVDCTSEDYEAIMNFAMNHLSKYVDNRHILDNQVNPHTKVAEKVIEPAQES